MGEGSKSWGARRNYNNLRKQVNIKTRGYQTCPPEHTGKRGGGGHQWVYSWENKNQSSALFQTHTALGPRKTRWTRGKDTRSKEGVHRKGWGDGPSTGKTRVRHQKEPGKKPVMRTMGPEEKGNARLWERDRTEGNHEKG